MKFLLIQIYLLIHFTKSLVPPNAPIQRKYWASKRPSSDLNALTSAETMFICNNWISTMRKKANIKSKDIIGFEYTQKIKKYIQQQPILSTVSQKNYTYIAWVPSGTIQDILFIVILENSGEKSILKSLAFSPHWETKQIKSHYLLHSLINYCNDSQKYFNVNEFLKTDSRYKLEWRIFKNF